MRMAATMDTGFDALANAIIERAANDYITAQRKLVKERQTQKAKDTIREVREFFNSEWFCLLSKVDGNRIIEEIVKRYERGKRKT